MALKSVTTNVDQMPPSPTSDGWPESDASTYADLDWSYIAAPAMILTYPDAVIKGQKLLGHSLTSTTAPSHFRLPTSLREWGYTTTSKLMLPTHPLYSALQTLAAGRTITAREVSSAHTTRTTHDGVQIPSTSAFFINAFDFNNGILIAGSNFGPDFASQHLTLRDGEALPELRRWSDVVYLQARFLTSSEYRLPEGTARPSADAIKGLKSVVRLGIENKGTNVVVHRIVQDKVTGACGYDTVEQMIDAGCPDCCRAIAWPGLTFEIGSQEGLALLGTPNGAGVAWLLMQHAELVGKAIARVTVWCDTEKHPLRPSVAFWIEDKDTKCN